MNILIILYLALTTAGASAFSPLSTRVLLSSRLQHSSTLSTQHQPLHSYSIESSYTGPSDSLVHTLTFHTLPGQDAAAPALVIETGNIGRQAAGAVTVTRGDTLLYATAARDDKPKESIDFLPLSVDYQERFSSAGLTSGSYNKRDGRPAEHEILTCRLIDRPLRPLIANGWTHETQLLSWVLSYDGLRSCDTLAILASAAALYVSDVPLTKPVAAVMVGMTEGGEFLVNPTIEEMDKSRLQLTIAGTAEGVLMIEGAADFLPEDIFIKALAFGHEAIKVLCAGLQELGDKVGVVKNYSTIKVPPEGLQKRVDELMTERVDDMYTIVGGKAAAGEVMSALSKAVVDELIEEFPDETIAIKGAFKDLLCRRMFIRAKEQGLRCDGRKPDEIRRLDMIAGFLPKVHGSALFTRGETQTIATTTLGDSGMRQKIDSLDGLLEKRFYLQYTFPPSCVGETGRTGAPGRREVGAYCTLRVSLAR
jgi:polyribonucleotide nucleotidyltransferase